MSQFDQVRAVSTVFLFTLLVAAGLSPGASSQAERESSTAWVEPAVPGPDPLAPRGPDPLISDMLSKMDINDMKSLFYELENKYSLPNRVTKSQNYLKSTDWIKSLVQTRRPNLDVQWHDESRGYRNIIITLPGADPSAGEIQVGGHLDSVAAGPGMDDDGSGALGSAWIGLAMAGYRFTTTVRFILFDAEESGLIGSGHYVNDIKAGCPPSTCLKYYMNL
ncbi:MAG TPA: M28 family peptidase, partial [Thermoplasmata archaeon]|nr:M28 family peptidase [Thermoplasmata archaeon]